MNLKIKETLARLIRNQSHYPDTKTWSNITPTTGQYVTLTTFTIPANSQYLIIANNGNSIAGAAGNLCQPYVASGSPRVFFNSPGISNDTSGNRAVGIAYVVTGNTPVNVAIRSYGYAAVTGAKFEGSACAIPLLIGGGGTA